MNIERVKKQLLQRSPTPRGGGINLYLEAYECIEQLEREHSPEEITMTDFRRIYKGTDDLEFELIGAKKEGHQPYLRVARRKDGDDEYLGTLEVRNLRRLRDAINRALE